jgi:hypothetical protein
MVRAEAVLKEELLENSVLAPYARAYRELRLPVVPDGKDSYGRLGPV